MIDHGWIQVYFLGPFGWYFAGNCESPTAATAFAAKYAPMGMWSIPKCAG